MTRSRFGALALLREALRGHRGWQPFWRHPEPKRHYDVVVIGGGGHGLATAYYLARNHGIRHVAVIEKGWLGGGNSGRNTQVCRSNYFHLASGRLYERSLQLYEGLTRELNLNVMLSQRGVLNVAYGRHELEHMRRWFNAIRMNGIDSEFVGPEEIRRLAPLLDPGARFPPLGGFIQHRAGVSRHDAVNWGYARGADALGVDLVQDCTVTGFERDGERVTGVQTSRGTIAAGAVALCAAGHASEIARLAGLRLPLVSMPLQAMVSEPVQPVLDTLVFSPSVHSYISQSERGELVIGGGCDLYPSYAQRGGVASLAETVRAVVQLFPRLSRLRLMRQWAGIVDISPDTSPILGPTPIDGLYLNAGWGTGGYKAIPVGGETMAWTIANGRAHELIVPFGLERFERGALIDEGAAAGVAH